MANRRKRASLVVEAGNGVNPEQLQHIKNLLVGLIPVVEQVNGVKVIYNDHDAIVIGSGRTVTKADLLDYALALMPKNKMGAKQMAGRIWKELVESQIYPNRTCVLGDLLMTCIECGQPQDVCRSTVSWGKYGYEDHSYGTELDHWQFPLATLAAIDVDELYYETRNFGERTRELMRGWQKSLTA